MSIFPGARLKAWTAVVLWCALIYKFSSLPGGGPTASGFRSLSYFIEFVFKKLCHIGEYAALFLLVTVTGITLSCICTFFAVRKFLRLRLDDLYY